MKIKNTISKIMLILIILMSIGMAYSASNELSVASQTQTKITSELELLQVYAKETQDGAINRGDGIVTVIKLAQGSESLNLNDIKIKIDTKIGSQTYYYSTQKSTNTFEVNFPIKGNYYEEGYISKGDLTEITLESNFLITESDNFKINFIGNNLAELGYNIYTPSKMSVNYIYLYPGSENDKYYINDNQPVKLTVIEDATCTNCQVDEFINTLKSSLMPDLEVEKISSDSTEGNSIVSILNAKELPIYLFSKNIDQRDDWQSDLASTFTQKNINGENMYMFIPNFIPNKILINKPKILDGSIIIGDRNAPVTIYEFADYSDYFSAVANGNQFNLNQFKSTNSNYQTPIPKIIENYVDRGDVKIVFYNFPLESLNPNSRIIHNAALCANEQKEFEDYSKILWEEKSNWINSNNQENEMINYAQELGLNLDQFKNCVYNKKYDTQISREINYGKKLSVEGTPAFFINKNLVQGAQDYSVFEDLIESELNKVDSNENNDETYYNYENTQTTQDNQNNYNDQKRVTSNQNDYIQDLPSGNSCTGCEVNDVCFDIGIRKVDGNNPIFCDTNKEFSLQKIEGAICQNNFECQSNSCSSGICVDIVKELKEQRNLLEMIIGWFGGLFN